MNAICEYIWIHACVQGLTCEELKAIPQDQRTSDGIVKAVGLAATAAKAERAAIVAKVKAERAVIPTRLQVYYAEAWEKMQTVHKVWGAVFY